ncbi:MAG: hypothetical protein R3F60_08215 [bacterium]
MARVLCSLAILLAACGAEPPRRPPLPEGRGLYTTRLNPPPCLAGRPELHVEVQTPQGWERVAVELPEEDGEDQVAALLDRFTDDALRTVQVEATFTGGVVAWGGRHQSRVLRILRLDPEVPDEP